MRLNGLFAFVAAASHAAERCCLEDRRHKMAQLQQREKKAS